MAFIKTVSPEKAEGKIAELYAPVLEMIGSVPKSLEMWSASPTRIYMKPPFTAPIWSPRAFCSRLSEWEKNRPSEPCDSNSNLKRQESCWVSLSLCHT